jgi:hypothetical protein
VASAHENGGWRRANVRGQAAAARTDTYVYVWKTDRSWANTCRQLIVKLDDGSVHRANFQFTR